MLRVVLVLDDWGWWDQEEFVLELREALGVSLYLLRLVD